MTSVPNAGRRRDAWDGLKARAAHVPLALWIVLLLGIELRVALWFSYQPVPMTFWDSMVYVGMAGGELFSDAARTAGYSIFLRGLHTVSESLQVTILFQHLLGIATAVLIYGAFRRLEMPTWVAVAAAAAVLLSLDQVFLEHALLSEAPFTFLVAASLYCAVRALAEPSELRWGITTRHLWIAGAGAALGLSAWMRSVTVPIALLLALWFAYALAGPWRARLGRAAISLAASAAVLLAYAGLNAAHTGYFGLTPASGWALYARTAQFADCTRFDPPTGTEELCEDKPPENRPGPDFYGWQPGSPAIEVFEQRPHGNEELTAFARTAILNQPLDYLKVATIDSLRYFYPALDERGYAGVDYGLIDIDRRAPAVEEEVNAALNDYYADDQVEVGGFASSLADLQDVLRLQPATMVLASILAIAGLVLARGRIRAGLILMVGISAALLVVPAATAIWSARYAVPVTGPLLGAAAAGAWLAATRLRKARVHRQER